MPFRMRMRRFRLWQKRFSFALEATACAPWRLLNAKGTGSLTTTLVSLFNRSGTIRLTAEGAYASFQNAKDSNDAKLIADCLLGIGETLSDRRMREHRLEVFVQACPTLRRRTRRFPGEPWPSGSETSDYRLHSQHAGCGFVWGRQVGRRSFPGFPRSSFPELGGSVPTLAQQGIIRAEAAKMFTDLASELGLDCSTP